MSIEMPCTLDAVRAMTPKNAKIQLMAHEQAMTSSPAATTAPKPRPGGSP
jgi:hypothetical protein